MRQHISALRHQNLEKGLPVPPRIKDGHPIKPAASLSPSSSASSGIGPSEKESEHQSKQAIAPSTDPEKDIIGPEKDPLDEEDRPKPMLYRCEICNCVLNSAIQLHQHLASSRHKALLEGKPPKPRWMPYHKYQASKLQTKLRLTTAQINYPIGSYGSGAVAQNVVGSGANIAPQGVLTAAPLTVSGLGQGVGQIITPSQQILYIDPNTGVANAVHAPISHQVVHQTVPNSGYWSFLKYWVTLPKLPSFFFEI